MNWFRIGMLSVGLSIFPLSHARASTITACNEASLRTALSAGGTIQFGCSGTIVLAQELRVTRDTTLDGSGRTVVLSGGGSAGVFVVRWGVRLRLVNITIINGYAPYGAALFSDTAFVSAENCTFSGNRNDAYGGAIWNSGTLTLTQCVFLQNAARYGGAIWNSGTLTLTECIFSQNTVRGADGTNGVAGSPGGAACRFPPAGHGTPGQPGGNAFGGAIYNESNAVALILNCTIQANTVLAGSGGNGGDGGANPCGPLHLAGHPGAAGLAEGAGIYNRGRLSLVGSTLSGNSARGGNGGRSGLGNFPINLRGAEGGAARGAGVANSGFLFVTNSTIAQNEAFGGVGGDSVSYFSGCVAPPDGDARGGDADSGIFNGGMLVVQNTTIWNNIAHGGPGGMGSTNGCPPSWGPSGRSVASLGASTNGTNILLNMIVANLGTTSNCVGVITDAGYNICSDHSAGFTNSTSRNGTDPRLESLTDNGGPTKTIALLADSPALDAGDPNNCLSTDQRGVPRPQGSACDIGAYEAGVLHLSRGPDGAVKIKLSLPAGRCVLSGSHDLLTWTPLMTNSGPGLLEYLDQSAPNTAARFFRAR